MPHPPPYSRLRALLVGTLIALGVAVSVGADEAPARDLSDRDPVPSVAATDARTGHPMGSGES